MEFIKDYKRVVNYEDLRKPSEFGIERSDVECDILSGYYGKKDLEQAMGKNINLLNSNNDGRLYDFDYYYYEFTIDNDTYLATAQIPLNCRFESYGFDCYDGGGVIYYNIFKLSDEECKEYETRDGFFRLSLEAASFRYLK